MGKWKKRKMGGKRDFTAKEAKGNSGVCVFYTMGIPMDMKGCFFCSARFKEGFPWFVSGRLENEFFGAFYFMPPFNLWSSHCSSFSGREGRGRQMITNRPIYG
jgi:hypothetical protein